MRYEPSRRREEQEPRDSSGLDLETRIADRAGEEPQRDAAVTTGEEPTLVRGEDEHYRAALGEIELLVEMRQAAASVESRDDGRARLSEDRGTSDEWGPFELLERLGGGASGEVYKVRGKHLKNLVALKLFHRERVASDELDSLLVEGRQHALVKHPNIAVIHGADENDGRVGIWMEYIDGATLTEIVREQGTFGPAEAVNIGRELCSALAAVHQQGLTHGDIKAQNVMREKDRGRIVLMDFSSARHVELDEESPGGLVGTPIYMAPELFDDRPSDFRSDIYALGVLLFYLVTGRHPYEAANLHELRQAVRSRKPLLLDDLRSDLPPAFVDAIEKATAWAPEDRFQSAGQFQAALREAIAPDARSPRDEPSPTPDLTPLLIAARVVTWSVIGTAFLGLLGFANEFNFNAALHVPEALTDYSLSNAVVLGLRSLAIPIVLTVIEIVVLSLAWGILSTLAPRAVEKRRRTVTRFVERLRRDGFDRAATWFALLSVVLVASSCYAFRDLWSLLVELTETAGPHSIDTTLLGAGSVDYHIWYMLVLTQVCLVLIAGWIVLFEIGPRAPATPTAHFMKWMSAAAIAVGVVVMCTPWKLLWKNESPPTIVNGVKGYVVAGNDETWFVYVPGGEHITIRAQSVPTGESNENVFGE